METLYYVVESIDGDYENLKRTDVQMEDSKLVARALLTTDVVVGSKVKYEMFQYELLKD